MKSDKPTRQMVSSLGKRSKFAHFDRKHFSSAAKLLAHAGFPSWAARSKLGEETRRFLMGDLGKEFKCSSLDLSLISDIFCSLRKWKTAQEFLTRP